MFFPRLRRRARWVFAFLALAFALAFVVAGVGTGLGSGIGDYLSELFNRQPDPGGGSLEDARNRVEKNPNDPEALLSLATALETRGEVDEAIATLERYTGLRPKDSDALQRLAGLYNIRATRAQERARVAQSESERTLFARDVLPGTGPLADAFQPDPITSALEQQTSARANEAIAETQRAYREEASVWQRVTALVPDQPDLFLELGRAAQFGGDTAAAIAAYERFLELSPDAATAPQVRALIKQLRAFGG